MLPHLKRQAQLLEEEYSRLLILRDTLAKTIDSYERRVNMTEEQQFKGFVWNDYLRYEADARKLYGDKLIDKAIEKQRGGEEEITAEFNRIFARFAQAVQDGESPQSLANIELAQALHHQLSHTGFDCTLEVFGYIGKGYVANPEFKANIDQFGIGTAQFVNESIQAYVSQAQA